MCVQKSINAFSRGRRSLVEGEEVEYILVTKPNGEQEAVSVTGPDGRLIQRPQLYTPMESATILYWYCLRC
jgi:hypothetical protein